MICIECCQPVDNLYFQSKNGYIKLTICSKCNQVVDKYVEFDKVVLFIDLLLLRPNAYRHLMYNSLIPTQNQDEKHFQPQIYTRVFRIWMLLLLFEVYVNWAYEEKSYSSSQHSIVKELVLKDFSIASQYLFFFFKSVLDLVSSHIAMQLLIRYWLKFPDPSYFQEYPKYFFPVVISFTICISSIIRLFPIAMLIWPYDIQALKLTKSAINFVNNFITIDCLNTILINNNSKSHWKLLAIVTWSNYVKALTSRLLVCFFISRLYSYSFSSLIQNDYDHSMGLLSSLRDALSELSLS
ncbi:Glycosylphosphatidylinositol intermediates transport to ER [Komagataella phaffii CBS 7435]|uniref:Protein ARV n=2 Tax=Komagataella phaffii TaxID=460519 RepID=C4R815_KOMPG|nr:Protein required for normal intracellular sterol distribution and for sphingolipid metabolism [Komagataella phaffii GS115]AOA64395.1 GQ67_04848T0 [Komagataella phaffii]CAH2450871.1 Glycosylphosphatidylinositol intermediates transport to ER [Komagataella phaffii CBS 7435]AOA70188.1 GQ68_04820T0 [Komagataella phaffii GS115]CAY71740.1 Protein required for normal intracellular sterol distribution and for sphingolipid metabolism [Komagataella phaffii GS115]SCV12375.1 Glycosylphosphatidylinositol